MKKNRILYILIMLLFITSCNTRYYRMEILLNKDGGSQMYVYTWGDSAFMAGNIKNNPFLFRLDSGWIVTRYDSAFNYDFFSGEQKLNVKASRYFTCVNEMNNIKPVNETDTPLAVPYETLTSHFRWFYTYYTFTSVFKEIQDKGPIPISNYMNEKEQGLWFQGDMSGFPGMNGMELNEVLDDIGQKFWRWYNRSIYEISFNIIERYDKENSDSLYASRLSAVKDTLYIMNKPKDGEDKEFTPTDICKMLDEYFKTRHFSILMRENKALFETLFQEKTKSVSLFNIVISYGLDLPDKPHFVNTALYDNGKWIWKVDAYRLLAADYIIKAEYRVANVWAFVVTILLSVFAFYGLYRMRKRKKR